MKKILLTTLLILLFSQTNIFAVCIEWSWVCNDIGDDRQVPSDQEVEMFINLWMINVAKREVERYWLEQIKAYFRSYNNSITTQESVREANLAWKITRAEMAKMMVNYSINILWKEMPTWVTCKFNDIENINAELQKAVIQSCELWIMWKWITSFRPNDWVTRAEFGTVLSRALRWSQNEWWTTYYQNHLKALKSEWIMNNISSPMDKEIRWYVMLMLMRSVDNTTKSQQKSNTDDQISDVIKMLD
jgi:hypothetical protein